MILLNFDGDPKYSKFWVALFPTGSPIFGPLFYSNWTYIARALSPTALNLNCWNHLAFTIDGSYYRIYINGTLTVSSQSNYLPEKFLKYSNFIGNYKKFILDQLRFYNRALSLTEIQHDMNTF